MRSTTLLVLIAEVVLYAFAWFVYDSLNFREPFVFIVAGLPLLLYIIYLEQNRPNRPKE